jgi:hypothetical protein
MRLSTDGVCIELLTLTKDRYAGFRAVAGERNGSPTALISLKHYKVLNEQDKS